MTQRIIKFRMWDIKEKRMRTVDDIHGLWTLNNHEGDVQNIPHVVAINQSYRGDDLGLVVDKDCYLMQFTNILDKNGKEIYESDILLYRKIKSKIAYLDSKTMKIVVKNKLQPREELHYWVVSMSPKGQWIVTRGEISQSLARATESHEVVGDIYSDPTLISHPL